MTSDPYLNPVLEVSLSDHSAIDVISSNQCLRQRFSGNPLRACKFRLSISTLLLVLFSQKSSHFQVGHWTKVELANSSGQNVKDGAQDAHGHIILHEDYHMSKGFPILNQSPRELLDHFRRKSETKIPFHQFDSRFTTSGE